MNGWTNSATWCVASIVDNDEVLGREVRARFNEVGEDFNVMFDIEDVEICEKYLHPLLTKKYEEVVRAHSWVRPLEIQGDFSEVNWSELAVAFLRDSMDV